MEIGIWREYGCDQDLLFSLFFEDSLEEPSDDFFALSDFGEFSGLEESSDLDPSPFLEEESPLEEFEEFDDDDGAEDFLA
jgi:hypothetical protein